MKINDYYKRFFSKEGIASNEHRDAVGGMWDEIGLLQFNFLIDQGLLPYMRLLDVGCGSLRGGIHFIKYLDAGNYYGIDVNQSLIDVGYDVELNKVGLQNKLAKENLLCDEHFKVSGLDVEFDYALALSVFTHLPVNHIRLCLIELSRCMKVGGRFYATFFECPVDGSVENPMLHEPGGITTYTYQDPYHYKLSDMSWCIEGLPWQLEYIGNWNHPRAQKILCFVKQSF